MSALVLCPDCKRKLKVPDSAVGKTIRCPTCKALLPPVLEPALDSEDSEPDTPSRRGAVTTAPPPRTAPTRPLSRPPEDEEAEDDLEPEEKPIRKRPSREARSLHKKSSAGLIIGLVLGGVALLALLGGGATLLWHFSRTLGKGIAQAEWQTFMPPNGDCSVLMPGTPQSQPVTTLGITVNKYLVTRTGEKAFFAVAFMNLGPDPLQPNALELVANAERDHIMRTLNGSVTSQTSITLGNLPGREFQITTQPRGALIERIYLANLGGTHRVYLVVAAGDYLTPNQDDVTRFFDSFKITAPSTPPTFLDAAAPLGGPKQPIIVNAPPANPGPMPPIVIPRPIQPRPIPVPRQPRPIPGFRQPRRPIP
jgi:hypothetical protein